MMLNIIIVYFSLKRDFFKMKNLGIIIKRFTKFLFDPYLTDTYATTQFIPRKEKKTKPLSKTNGFLWVYLVILF